MIAYTNIRISTSEKARHDGKPLAEAVVHVLRGLKIAARCSVYRGHGALYESGEVSWDSLTDLSYNLPVLIDILVPEPESAAVLDHLKTLVHEGVIAVLPVALYAFHSQAALLPAHLLVRDLMSQPVQAHPDFTLRTVLELMLDRGLKALPVVDSAGIPVGMVTTTDLVAAGMPVRTGLFSELSPPEQEAFLDKAARIPVTGVMRRHPVTVHETSKAAHAVRLMVEHQKKRLPVVDAHGRLVGVISRIDLLRAVSNERPPTERTIGDIAKLAAVPVPETADLLTAIDVLVKQGEERAAVVDAEGKLVGIVSDRELFAVLGRSGLGDVLRRLFFPRHPPRTPVSQVMKRDFVSVPQGAPAAQALKLMVEHGLKRLPVVDGQNHFVGMIRRDALLISLSHDL